MLCPHCNNENRTGAKFCDECGAKLTVPDTCAPDAPADEDVRSIAPSDVEPSASGADSEGIEADDLAPVEGEAEPVADVVDAPQDTDEDAPSVEAELPEVVEDLDSAAAEPTDEEAEWEYSYEYADTPASTAGFLGGQETVPISANLAGFDRHPDEFTERIVSPEHLGAMTSNRDGNTMQMPRVSQDESQKAKEYRAPEKEKRHINYRKVAIVIGILVALAAGVAAITYWMQLWGGKVVPDVTGMTEADARSVLTDSGFAVRTLEIKSDDTEGLVILSDPASGTRQDEGMEVVIHIASSREIPDVIGKTKGKAKKLLKKEGYENIKFKKEKSDNEKGTVIATDPKPGTAVKSTSKVTVTLATPYVVPDTVGLDVDGAIAAIQAEGLSYEIVEIETEDYVDGDLMGTVPEAGTEVKKADVVTIQVALVRGPELESLAMDYLAPGSEVTIGMYNYVVDSIESVTYIGDDTVEFTITGKPFTELLGQTLTGNKRSVTGSIVFSPDNKIVEVS